MKQHRIWNAVLFTGALLVMAALSAVLLPMLNKESGFSLICIPVTLVYACGAVLLFRGSRTGRENLEPLWVGAVLAILALTVLSRVSLLPHASNDFTAYLSIWLSKIRDMPGFTSLAANIGDYNTPYFYMLFAIGKLLPQSADLYVIKLVSILFDYVLAYFVMKLVMLKTARRSVAVGSFIATLLVPSIIINSAMWGQCDSIFTAFSLGALYYGLCGKSRWSWAFFAIALSVKLQSVFLLPMLLVLLFTKRIRLQDIWVFPAVFIALLIPAMIAGRGFIDCITIYWRQANSYAQLTMIAPSIFAWLPDGTFSIPVSGAGVLTAGTVTLLFLTYLLRRRKQLDNEAMIVAAFLFTLIIPFFLPRMHERYFYAADAMAAVYLFWHPKRWYLSLFVCISSFLCHSAFLFEAVTVPLWLLSFCILAAICLLLRDFVPRTESRCKEITS